jgi:hypothetical protein
MAAAFCLVPQPRLVCAEYFASELVVEGKLVRTEVLRDPSDPQGILAHVYTLTVDKVLRGAVAGPIRVYEGNDSGRATFDWDQGTSYLLFLFFVPTDRAWELDGCGSSGPLSRASVALSDIDLIKTAHDGGIIYGSVGREMISKPFPGAQVEIQGKRTYSAISDQKGEFEVRVPAGTYRVHVAADGFSFAKADISYADPEEIRIEPGGCAQVQFVGIVP